MNISEKINEMQGDLAKYNASGENEEDYDLENMVMIMLNDHGCLGPGKILDESDEYLDFMNYENKRPIFSLSIKKDQICGISVLHKAIDEELSASENAGMPKALYQ